MASSIVQRLESHLDLNFIPAYISALLSGYYVLAKHPPIAALILTRIISIFRHCSQARPTSPPQVWELPELAMIPICIVLATSLASIQRHVKTDRLYAALILVAVCGAMGLGWTLQLTADLVVCGLLPISVVSALMATRLGQNLCAARIQEADEHMLTEKLGGY